MSPEVSPLVAGCASAGLTTLLLQPLDLVKTRLQEDRGARVATEVRAIVAEGGVRALWTGVTPSLWRTVPGVGLYFWLYHRLAGGRQLGTLEGLLVGGVTRVAAGSLLIPLTVVKTRWEAKGAERVGLVGALVGLARGEGVRGLVAGLAPTLLRDAPYSALYLGVYSGLQQLLPAREAAVQGDRVVAALLAGMAATTLVHPADVVKTRLQLAGAAPGLAAALGGIWREGGARGFLVGLAPRLVRKSLVSGLAWTSYEAAVWRPREAT